MILYILYRFCAHKISNLFTILFSYSRRRDARADDDTVESAYDGIDSDAILYK